jgi:hypothetical protein
VRQWIISFWHRLFGKRDKNGTDFVTTEVQPEAPQPNPRPQKPIALFRNAPKRQPCFKCRRWVKRLTRTTKTAEYHCPKCRTVNVVSLRGQVFARRI